MPVLNFAGNDVFKWDGFDQTASSFSGTPANANITITPVNDPPVLGGTFTTASTINDNATIQPFSGVTVSDVDSTNVSVHITFTAANGTLSGTGVTGSNGNYTITSAAIVTATSRLQGLTFTPTANQVVPGSTVATTFTLTPNDGIVNGTADATSKVTATSINNAPVNTVVPVVSGTAKVGNILSGTTGTWMDVDVGAVLTFSRQWFRADNNAGLNDAAISGATASTYSLTSTDANKFIRIVVTANDGQGSSNQSAPSIRTQILNSAPIASSVTVSGTATVGNTLTGHYIYVDVDGDAQGTSTFRWLRGGTAITGATAQTYTLVTADSGQTITFEVTPVAATGTLTGTAVASAGKTILNSAPTASSVTVSGTAKVGNTLTGSYTYADVDGDAQGISTFRWLRGGTAITGATAQTYTLVTADSGQPVAFEVTPVAATGVSNGTAVVSANTAVELLAQINDSNFSLDTGTHSSRQLSVSGGSGTFTYATSDPAIVTVSSTGMVTVVGVGTATITLTDTARNTTSMVVVTVTVPLVLSSASTAVDSTGAATITPTGGSSTNTAAVTTKPGVATGTVTTNANGSFTFTSPTTGAFAGDYVITVTDTISGFNKTVTVSVPMQVSISSLNIAESDTTQTITVSGMANSDVISFNIKDANGVSDTGVNAIAADIVDSTPTSNQVVKTITPANVNVITPFTITATNTSNTTLAALTTKRMHIVPENSIAISVNNATTGIAVAGVTLKLRNPAPLLHAASKSLTTDTSGVASATLPIGKYVYTVFKKGFSPLTTTITVTATGVLTKTITLRPIAALLNFTGSLSTVPGVDFTASLPTVIAVDANGNQMFATVTATNATTATFSLGIDSNDFIPVAFIAKDSATHSVRIIITPSMLAAGGTVGAFPVLKKRNANISVVELAKANVAKADFTSKFVDSATLTKPAGVTTIVVAAEALPGTSGAFAATTNLRQPTDPVIELMKDASGHILSAPVKHPPSTARTVLGTKVVVVGGGPVSAVTDTKTHTTVSVQLPADAFKTNDSLSTLTPGNGTELFVTFNTVNTTSTQANLSAQKAIEVDLVLIDSKTGTVLSTLSGNHNLNRVRVSIPVDPNVLTSLGIAPASVEAAFTAGTLQINTAQTIAEFDAGITTVITGPFAYDQLTGNISFFTSHFSIFGVGSSAGGGTGGGTTLLAGGGGCALSGVDTPFDPLLPTLALLAAGWLWGRRKLKVEKNEWG